MCNKHPEHGSGTHCPGSGTGMFRERLQLLAHQGWPHSPHREGLRNCPASLSCLLLNKMNCLNPTFFQVFLLQKTSQDQAPRLYLIVAPSPCFLWQKSWHHPKLNPPQRNTPLHLSSFCDFHMSFPFLYDLVPPVQLKTPDDQGQILQPSMQARLLYCYTAKKGPPWKF